MEFEKAIEYRELLNSVKQVAQKQKITSSGREDRDIVAMARAMEDVVVQVFFIREGKMIGRDHFTSRREWQKKRRDHQRVCKTVLCRNSFYPKRSVAPVSH